MKRVDFLNLPEVIKFTDWLSQIIDGSATLSATKYHTLSQALQDYRWPPKRVDLYIPSGKKAILPKNSTLEDNQTLLNVLQVGLKSAITNNSNKEAIEWVKCILTWGGVYTHSRNRTQGNAGWLEARREESRLIKYLKSFIEIYSTSQHDQVGKYVDGLRSNAGLTKIHSLIIEEFIIYDSRVAAALSWLVLKWAGDPSRIPEVLRFATMRANTSRKEGKVRTACKAVFPYFSPSGRKENHQRHLMWNIRANWVLSEALRKAKRREQIRVLRDLEAALFMIGDDLKALQ